MVDGTGICKGVQEPNFTPFILDLPRTIYFPSVNPANNAPYGSLLLYSNED
jgi:hypothetical protein